MSQVNDLGQPIGAPVADWSGCSDIAPVALKGRTCDVVPLSVAHGDDLWDAYSQEKTGKLWTYLFVGPFDRKSDFDAWIATCCASTDTNFVAIIDKRSGKPLGIASYLRMQPSMGVAEVGNIAFSPALQRSIMATEAMYLMMKHLFDDLGYRRYEWKCDALNAPSRAAALRVGFQFEGIFQQAIVYKGRNRDTAWFAIIDQDWPAIKQQFENWLAVHNFDESGQQKQRLQAR